MTWGTKDLQLDIITKRLDEITKTINELYETIDKISKSLDRIYYKQIGLDNDKSH